MQIEFVKPHPSYIWQKHVYDNLSKYNCIVKDRQTGKTEVAIETGYSIIHSPNIKYPKWAIASDEIGRVFRAYGARLNAHFSANPHFKWENSKQNTFRIPRIEGDYITIDVFGSKANFFGAKGGTYHYFLADEYGQMGDGYFEEVAQPTVRKTGGIVFITGTVEDNWWYDLFQKAVDKHRSGDPHWFAFSGKWGDEWSKKDFSKKELEAVKAAFDLNKPNDLRLWQKEYLCDWFAASIGKIYSRSYARAYESKRIGVYPYDPRYKVGICLDNGHTTAVWFYQMIEGRPRLINYLEFIEYGFDEIAKDIKKWYNEHRAVLDIMIFPHTMYHRHQSANMKSNADVFLEAWGGSPEVQPIPKVAHLETKIDATRRLVNRSYFNSDTTQAGLRSLRNYKRTYQRSKGYVTNQEDKQWSHGVDALGELALAIDNGVFDDSLDRKIPYSRMKQKGIEEPVSDSMMKKFERMESNKNKKSYKTYLGGY